MLLEGSQALERANNFGSAFSPRGNSIKAQLERAAISIENGEGVGAVQVCSDCVKAGVIQVKCSACQQQISLNDVHIKIGSNSPDFICQGCYVTMTAANYGKLVDELEEDHQYDDE
jgi:hypothetical protein